MFFINAFNRSKTCDSNTVQFYRFEKVYCVRSFGEKTTSSVSFTAYINVHTNVCVVIRLIYDDLDGHEQLQAASMQFNKTSLTFFRRVLYKNRSILNSDQPKHKYQMVLRGRQTVLDIYYYLLPIIQRFVPKKLNNINTASHGYLHISKRSRTNIFPLIEENLSV